MKAPVPIASARLPSRPGHLRAASWALLVLAASWVVRTAADQQPRIAVPDNPLGGRVAFEEKLCSRCHGIGTDGSRSGPDVAARHVSGSFFDLGAALWNHVPGMSVHFEARRLAWPQITDEDAVALIAFLYYIEYLGRPGDPDAGERVFHDRGCAGCHAIGDPGTSGAPDLTELDRFASPLFIAQAIWNHGPSMLESMQRRGIVPPQFAEGDLADLSAFIRRESQHGPQQPVLLAPGNPNRGAEVFAGKGCSRCHRPAGGERQPGPEGGGPRPGPDLRRADLHHPAETIAGRMWNHALAMRGSMAQARIGWPRLTTEELADLVAYLYFLSFRDPPGDPRLGAEVFARRSCAGCHAAAHRSLRPGPQLGDARAARSPEALVAAMWNHAPVMQDAVLREGRPWPELDGTDLRHIYAYLRDLARAPSAPE